MRAVFWLVGLAAAAVALALLVGQNGATVTLFWSPYRVDMSFNLVLAGVVTLFVLLYVVLRSVAALRALPHRARRWRWLQKERAATAALVDAWINQKAGRFVRARSAAGQAIEHAEQLDAKVSGDHRALRVMAHLLAAEAEHALQHPELRDRHMQAAQSLSRASDSTTLVEASQLRALHWAVGGGEVVAAQRLMADLPQGVARRTAVLRLKLRLSRMTADHATGLETARLLAKHRAFSASAATSLLRQLRIDLIQHCTDAGQLRQRWQSMDPAERADPELIVAGLERLGQLPSDSERERLARVAVHEWASPLLSDYAGLPEALRPRFVSILQQLMPRDDTEWLARIENLQRAHPADPHLTYLTALTCYEQKLWGKATTFFQQATRSLNEPHLLAESWARLAQLAQERGDDTAALAAWRQAATLSGGRLSNSRTSP